jgi:hypothetical protein
MGLRANLGCSAHTGRKAGGSTTAATAAVPVQRVVVNKKQPSPPAGGANLISYLTKRASSAALRVSYLTKLGAERGGG